MNYEDIKGVMMKHCPLCNISSDKSQFVGELCISCFKRAEFKKLPDRFIITKCKRCKRIKTPRGYEQETKKSLERVIEKEFRHYKYTISLNKMDYAKRRAIVNFKINKEGKEIAIKKEIGVSILKTICDTCSRKAAGYYEAIVQLRGSEKEVSKISNKLALFLKRNGAFISKIEKHDYGEDIFTSDKKITDFFIGKRKMKAKRSFRLYGVKKGKKLYRNTYSIYLD